MEFSKQEYWSGFPFPSPGDLPNPGIEPRSPALEADALTSEPPGKPEELKPSTSGKHDDAFFIPDTRSQFDNLENHRSSSDHLRPD